MTKNNQVYSIGQLAKMCNVSAKQLRYLDEKRILVPTMRNSDNNYRYYSSDQLNRLVIIKTLRDFGFSFSEVVEALQTAEPGYFSEAIQKRLRSAGEEIQGAIFRYEQLAAYYTHYLKSNSFKNFNDGCGAFKLITIPKQMAIYTRYKAAATSWQLFTDRFFELRQICHEKRIAASSSMIAIFHDGYLKQFDDISEDLETMIPVSGAVLRDGNVRDFGDFQGVTTCYQGKYGDMRASYLDLEEWAKARGIQLMDVSIEIYHLGPDMISDPDAYLTQLIIPLSGSEL